MVAGRRFPLPSVLIGAAGVALVLGLGLQGAVPTWRGHAPQLHSAIEALGGLCAIVMALLLFKRRDDGTADRATPLGIGFLSMGVLEECHAIASSQTAFVFLRGMASFFGSAGFALTWLPVPQYPWLRSPRLPWIIAGLSAAIGLLILAGEGFLPDMLRNGEFSPTAVAPTSLASLLFLATALRFALDYRESPRPEAYLFACLAMLFGLAECMFTYSLLWDARWWFWHVLRLFAYLLVLNHLVRGYQRMMTELHTSLGQTRRAEESVRQRERELRQVLEERERIGQDLHDGIIQSLFALSLSLERCKRLIAVHPDEVATQLGSAVQSAKAMIGDLRGYLAGMEPRIGGGRELEAALALHARMMDTSSSVRFAVRVDPDAGARIGPDEAVHLLYIAKEAMSNVLRHAAASRGTVALESHGDGIRLTIEDDGTGFAVDAPHTGEGLQNMAARAGKLQAALGVSSRAGHGTRIVVDLPARAIHG